MGWVVVTDPAIKQQVAAWYLEGWDRAYGSRRDEIPAAPPGPDGLTPRSFLAAEHLAHHIADVPVWIFPVLRHAAGAVTRIDLVACRSPDCRRPRARVCLSHPG